MPELPQNLKEKMQQKSLTLEDVLDNLDLLSNIPVEQYMLPCLEKDLGEALGPYNLQEVLSRHFDVFSFIIDTDEYLAIFSKYYNKSSDFDSAFTYAVRNLIYETALFGDNIKDVHITTEYLPNGQIIFKAPRWASSMNFEVKENIKISELTSKTILKKIEVGYLISVLNPEYIMRFNKETGYFSKTGMQIFERIIDFYKIKSHFPMLNPVHSYQEFTDFLATTFDKMRRDYSGSICIYLLKEHFQEQYPFLFLKDDAPMALQEIFYNEPSTLNYVFLSRNKKYHQYFLHLNLENFFEDKPITIHIPGQVTKEVNLIKYYTSKFGNQAFFDLVYKYGSILNHIQPYNTILEMSSESKEDVDKSIRNALYILLRHSTIDYEVIKGNQTTDFINEHPDIFIEYEDIPIEEEEKRRTFYNRFYRRIFDYEDFQDYPALIDLFKDKDLKVLFYRARTSTDPHRICIYDLIDILSNEDFLSLLAEYGNFLDAINNKMRESDVENVTFEELKSKIEGLITEQCRLGELDYTDEYYPKFLKEKHPELFLSEDAPKELKKIYYNSITDLQITFKFSYISRHPEYLPYLKGKSLVGAFIKAKFIRQESALIEFFELFDADTALKLICQKPDTIKYMLNNGQPELMKTWYEATGRKFIPDFIVMEVFPVNEIDKFIAHGRTWSSLQKITRYSINAESKDALLKLAYTFGIFHGDASGLTKLKQLLIGLPKTIPSNYTIIVDSINMKGKEKEDPKNTIKYPAYEEIKAGKIKYELSLLHYNVLYKFLEETLLKEGFQLEPNRPIIYQIYKMKIDGSYELAINPQDYPESSYIIRILLEKGSRTFLLRPSTAHRLFGGFKLRYDKDFREFLLNNLDTVLHDFENGQLISRIQRQFQTIKTVNSNRVLTYDLAANYVKENTYADVELGNEQVADISRIAGYSQEEFEILQQIYNYGRQRIFSSIPRIENKIGDYTYEILRLDDPLALAIGTLTDCCQEIGNFAETCVEHSMVDKNGRIFIIRDTEGNIVSQSWIWRNNNVLCFDNIEIPDKAINRAKQSSKRNDTKEFTDIVFNIYKQAAQELIELDDQRFKELRNSNQITDKQYEECRLRNVTVGIGYNDIAEAIKKHADLVTDVAHPLPFTPPVPLTRALWTNDSQRQYLLASTGADIALSENTLTIYSDTFQIYDKDTLTVYHLLSLQRLEEMTKEYNSSIEFEDNSVKYPIDHLAQIYSLNSENTKVIMNSNFAIIYEEDETTIIIADLLYTLSLSEGKMDITNIVIMQIRLALNQISQNKTIELPSLSSDQLNIYNAAMSLTDELDIERGIKHGK